MSGDRHNGFGQPIGAEIAKWSARPHPPRTPMIGQACRLEPLSPERHGAALFAAQAEDSGGRNWTYLFGEAPSDWAAYNTWLERIAHGDDPLYHAIVLPDGEAAGLCAYLRIDGGHGCMEVGSLNFSPRLQRTRAATEAMYLMMKRAFDELGYRRYEWKCDSLNAPSRRAAERLGFRFEGVFRQHMVIKGRNRDTAWFAILDSEWPAIRSALEAWLHPANFHAQGAQIRPLAEFMASFSRTARPVA